MKTESNNTEFITKCIGGELRYIFAERMEVNLKGRYTTCSGSLLHDDQIHYEKTEVKVVLGNRMQYGFYLSSNLVKEEGGSLKVRMDLLPLEPFDDRFTKSMLKPDEVIESMKIIEKDKIPSLYLHFSTGDPMLFSAVVDEQSEPVIIIKILNKEDIKAVDQYDVKEEF